MLYCLSWLRPASKASVLNDSAFRATVTGGSFLFFISFSFMFTLDSAFFAFFATIASIIIYFPRSTTRSSFFSVDGPKPSSSASEIMLTFRLLRGEVLCIPSHSLFKFCLSISFYFCFLASLRLFSSSFAFLTSGDSSFLLCFRFRESTFIASIVISLPRSTSSRSSFFSVDGPKPSPLASEIMLTFILLRREVLCIPSHSLFNFCLSISFYFCFLASLRLFSSSFAFLANMISGDSSFLYYFRFRKSRFSFPVSRSASSLDILMTSLMMRASSSVSCIRT